MRTERAPWAPPASRWSCMTGGTPLCRSAGRRKASRPLVVGDVGAYQTAEWHDLGCRIGGRGGSKWEVSAGGTRAGAPPKRSLHHDPKFNSGPRRPPRDDAGTPARARGLAVTAEPRRATISYPAWPGYPARRRRACLRRPPATMRPSAFHFIGAKQIANRIHAKKSTEIRDC